MTQVHTYYRWQLVIHVVYMYSNFNADCRVIITCTCTRLNINTSNNNHCYSKVIFGCTRSNTSIMNDTTDKPILTQQCPYAEFELLISVLGKQSIGGRKGYSRRTASHSHGRVCHHDRASQRLGRCLLHQLSHRGRHKLVCR